MSETSFDQPDIDFGRNFAALAERDIDFLLLEEFQVNDDFVAWFCGELELFNIKPGGAWHSIFDADGETDLLLRVYHVNDSIGVLIENKVAAVEQPGQADRYRIRGNRMIEQGKLSNCKTVICAPAAYLKNRAVRGYDQTISYEKIAAWFTSQRNRRADWRAHVMREAIAQSRRGYTMVKDPVITEFQKKYWEYLTQNYPRILMNEPGDRGPNSTWIILKGRGFPKGVQLNHKLTKQIMELAFMGRNKAELLAHQSNWPDDIIVEQKGNDATIALVVPRIDIRAAFGNQIAAIDKAFQAAERLMKYASIFDSAEHKMPNPEFPNRFVWGPGEVEILGSYKGEVERDNDGN